MPKTPRNDQEINEFKNKIIDVAAQVVKEDGFQNLSLRKIGARMNMAAPSLYYYFANKDEINIAIRKRAGDILYEKISAAYGSVSDLKTKAWNMIRAYVEFGLYTPHYYEVMFDSAAPKYTYYVGTVLEKIAAGERESTLRSLELMSQCVMEFKAAGYNLPQDIGILQISLWSQLHGIVSLYNNGLLDEVGYSRKENVTRVADLFFLLIMSFIEKKE